MLMVATSLRAIRMEAGLKIVTQVVVTITPIPHVLFMIAAILLANTNSFSKNETRISAKIVIPIVRVRRNEKTAVVAITRRSDNAEQYKITILT